MATTKNDRIYVRITDELKDDFEKVAEHRGLKTSSLLHSLIVKTIHEARRENPEIFVGVPSERKFKTKTLDEIKKITNKKPSRKGKADD